MTLAPLVEGPKSKQFAQLSRFGELKSAINLIDQQMGQAFEDGEMQIEMRLDRRGDLGHTRGDAGVSHGTPMLWQKICQRFLSLISDQE